MYAATVFRPERGYGLWEKGNKEKGPRTGQLLAWRCFLNRDVGVRPKQTRVALLRRGPWKFRGSKVPGNSKHI